MSINFQQMHLCHRCCTFDAWWKWMWCYHYDVIATTLKPGSQYDARASVASRVLGWRWNRLDFYSNVASRALASVQPIRLSKKLMCGMQFDWWKRLFSVTLTTLTAPASYCEPGFRLYNSIQCKVCIQNITVPTWRSGRLPGVQSIPRMTELCRYKKWCPALAWSLVVVVVGHQHEPICPENQKWKVFWRIQMLVI